MRLSAILQGQYLKIGVINGGILGGEKRKHMPYKVFEWFKCRQNGNILGNREVSKFNCICYFHHMAMSGEAKCLGGGEKGGNISKLG